MMDSDCLLMRGLVEILVSLEITKTPPEISFERIIEDLIEKSLKAFGRDQLWLELKAEDTPGAESSEWTALFFRKDQA